MAPPHEQPSKIIITHFWNSIDESWRVAIVAFLIARLFYAVWSWVIFTIQPVAVQNFDLSNEPIVSVFSLINSESQVYRREIRGNILSFQRTNTSHLIDEQTGSIWEIWTGKAVSGEYQGSVLSSAKTAPEDIFPYLGVPPYPRRWLAMWQRFDANWYTSIAEIGYGSTPGDIHFPPLYPMLMRTFHSIFQNTFLAGVVIAHLATIFALKLLYDFFVSWGDLNSARRALFFLVIFPTFFFFFSAYTEALFLVTALLSLRAMHSRAWGWAGFWVFCAILIRLQGVALLGPMVYLMWRDPPFLRKFSHWTGFMIAGAAGLLYLYLRSQLPQENTLPFVETNLHARLAPPWESYWYSIQTLLSGNATFIDALNWLTTTLFILLLIWGWKKISLEYSIYSATTLLILMTRIVETQPLMSMIRYVTTLFPCFYMLSLAGENPWMRRAIIYSSILLNLYLSGQFFIWGWVA